MKKVCRINLFGEDVQVYQSAHFCYATTSEGIWTADDPTAPDDRWTPLDETIERLRGAVTQSYRTITELCRDNDDPLASNAGLIRPLLRQAVPGL